MFETIYCWFVAWFGNDLADYLAGGECLYDDDGQFVELAFSGSNQFPMYGFIALGIALAVMLIYYYVINHPRFNRWWSWLLMLLLVGFVNLFIGSGILLGDYYSGVIGDCIPIYLSDCWMFGLANFFVSAIFFIIFSVGLKWWSTNCKRTPF